MTTITTARAFGAAIVLAVRNALVRSRANPPSRFRRVGCAMRTIALAPRLFPLLVLSALTAPAFAATSAFPTSTVVLTGRAHCIVARAAMVAQREAE